MARVDDFVLAKALSKNQLSGKDIDSIIGFSGASPKTDMEGQISSFSMKFLGRTINVSWPEMEFSWNNSAEEIPIQQQVLLLHYLNGAYDAKARSKTEEWISFQDLPDGRFYMDAFIRRAKIPLLETFGSNPKRMTQLAFKVYNASAGSFGDYSAIVEALPMIQVALVLWEGDDEFAPDGNILFDRGISAILPAEDIALLAGMVVYPLVGMAKK
jgi:hypothetical protein